MVDHSTFVTRKVGQIVGEDAGTSGLVLTLPREAGRPRAASCRRPRKTDIRQIADVD
jgi:hypothetical protein